MPPSNEELAEIKAALNPGFEYDPDSSQTYNEQLEVYRYPLKQVLEQQKYAGQHHPYYSDLPASENNTNTAQAIQAAADANAVVNEQAKLEEVAALLNDPNTPDAERLELYDQLTNPEAREKFNNKFPGLLPQPSLRVAPVDNVLSVKEQQAQAFSAKLQAKKQQLDTVKKQSAIAVAKAKFQKQPIPPVQPREVPTISTPAASTQQVSASIPDQTEFTVPSVDTPVEPQRSVDSTTSISNIDAVSQIPSIDDLAGLVSEDNISLTQLSDELTKVSGSSSLLDSLSAPDYMPTTPVEQSNGRVAKHVDGSWSVTTSNGQILPGLDEVTAKSFSAYNLADEIARSKGAPAGTLGTLTNLFMQSWAIPVEMAASAFTGPTTLTEKVNDWNKGMLEGQKNPITDAVIASFKAGTLSENHPKFKVLTRLNTEATENKKQFQSIKQEADLYRDKFPVNDKDYRGATAAYDVIAKNQGNIDAIWNAITNDPGAYIEQGVGSIGFMVALTVGAPPVQLAILATLAKGRANQAIEEFSTREKRDATNEERFRIKWASAAGLVAEKVSAGIVVKTIGKAIPGSQLAWTQKVIKNVQTSTPAKIANLKIIQPVIGIGSEASQGAATSFFEQYAQTGTVDADKVIFDAFQEGIATPGAAGGMIATNLAYQTGKGISKEIIGYDKKVTKNNLQNTLADIEAKLADINKRERLASIETEKGAFSQAADQEKQSLDPLKRTQFKETEAATDLKKELKEIQSQIKAIEDTGRAAGEQLELNLNEETTPTQSSAAKEEVLDLQNKETELNKTLDAFVSPEIEEQIQANIKQELEKGRDIYRTILATGKFSEKDIAKTLEDLDAKTKNDPDVGKTITDEDLNKVLDDLGIVQSTSSLQKLKNVAKRGLTSGQKTKVKTILDKSLDKVLNAGETAFSIFGSNFLEGALDSDNLTIDQLEQEKEQAPTDKDKQLIDQVIVAKKLKEQLEREEKSTIDKSLEEVDTEALEGQSARWKGLNTYRKEIIKLLKEQDAATNDLAKRRLTIPINNLIAKLRNHAGNLNRKITAFKEASVAYNSLSLEDKKLASGKGVIIIGKRKPNSALREMTYEVAKDSNGKPLVLTEEQFKVKRKAGLKSGKSNKREYVFKVGGNSKSIIRTLQNEANFGNATVGVIEGYKDTSYNTTLEEQKSQRLANEELETELQSIKLDLQEPEKEATAEEISAVELETDAPPVEPAIDTELTPEQKEIAELKERVNDLEAQIKGQSKTETETGQSQSETPTPSETTTTPTSTTESPESLVNEETGEFIGDTRETPFKPDEFEQQESSTTTEEEESTEEIDTEGSLSLKGILKAAKNIVDSTSKNLKGTYFFKEGPAKSVYAALGVLSKSVLDLITINDRNIGINTLKEADFTNTRTLSRALQELGLSVESANILSNRYITDFKKRYDEIISLVSQPAAVFRRPLTVFMQEGETTLPQSVLFTLMLTTLGRAQKHPNNVTFRSNFDRELFLTGGKGKLEGNDHDQLANLGADYTQTIESLGREALNILKIEKIFKPKGSVTPQATEIYYRNLGVALGITAVQIANTEIKGKERLFSIETHIWKFDNPKKGRFQNGKEYRHIVTNEKTGITQSETAALERIHELNGSKIVDEQGPLQEPPKDIPNSYRIKNTLTSIPIKVKAVLSTLQNTPWKAAESMDVFSKLAQNGYKNVLYTLAGYQEFDPATRMKNERESLNSQNSDKTTAIDEVLAANEAGDLKNFYFSYDLQNHHRIMMQGRINPQNSKITRFLLSSWGAATYTNNNIWKFKLGVAQNLGFKVDKNDFKTTSDQFNKIRDDKLIQEAVKQLSILKDAKGTDQKKSAKKLAELLPQIQGKYKVEHGTSIINALTGLSQYKPGKKFKSDLVMEIDGISNGWAMTVLQFPVFGTTLERVFAQVGIYFGENPEHDTKQEDVYQTLVKHIKKFSSADSSWKYRLEQYRKELELSEDDFQEFIKTSEFLLDENDHKAKYKKKNDALTQLYPDLKNGDLRSFVKYPFLIYMYGGGIDEISKGLAGDIVKSIYSQLGQMQREYNELKNNKELSNSLELDLEARKILARTTEDYKKEVVDPYFKNLNEIGIIDGSIKEAFTSGENIYEKSLNDAELQTNIADTLAPRFNYGLEAMLGATKEARNAVTQMGSILHAVFQAHYDKAYNEALQIKDVDGNVVGKRGSLTRTEINNLILVKNKELMKVYPAYRGPLAEINENIINGGVDLTSREPDPNLKTEDTVVQDFTIDEKNTDVTSSPSSIKFVAPGVSALIRQIINMDSVLLTLTLESHPDLLMLHDAFMGTPEQLVEAAKEYNEHYLKLGLEHSIIEETYQRVLDVVKIARSNKLMPQVNEYLKAEHKFNRGYDAMMTRSQKSTKKVEDDKSIEEVVKRVRTARLELKKIIKDKGLISAFQMFMPTKKSSETATLFRENLVEEVEETFTQIANIEPTIIEQTGIPSKSKTGTPRNVAAQVSRIKNEILIDPKEIERTYNKKAWENPQVPGVNKLAPDLIQSLEEWKIFLIAHERAHLTKFNTRLKTEASRENHANNEGRKAVLKSRKTQDEKGLKELKSLEGLPRSNPKTKLTSAVTLDTIKKLFSTMKAASVNYYGSKTAMDSHTSVLENVLDILGKGLTETSNLGFTLEQIDGISQGKYETAINKVTVSVARQAPPSINTQSPQEIYAHELVHTMTWQAINNSPLVADNIAALYRQVESDLKNNPKFKGQPWRVFIPAGRKPSQNEIDVAKQNYAYLFDNPKQEARKLHEFLAYAVTNRQMVEYLQTQPSAMRKDFIGKFMRAIEAVVNTFKRVFGNATSAKADQNAFEQMLAVTEHLVAIQSKHQSKVQQLQSKTYDFLDETDKKLKQFAFEKSVELMSVDSATGKARLVVAGTVAGAVHTLSNNATSIRLRNQTNKLLGKTLRGVANEIGGGALSEKMIEQLLQAKVNVSKARQEAERSSIHWFTGHKQENIDSIWKSVDPSDNHAMPVELKEALTDVLFRTDLSSLINVGFSHASIVDLIGDIDAVNTAERKLKVRLKRIQSKGFKPAIRHAEELGYHIATGKTYLRNGHMNAHTIAQEHLENVDPEVVSILDAYATLEAVRHLDINKANDVKALALDEFRADSKQNAIIDLLDSHLFYKEDSLNGLFNGNPTQMVKGYIIERVDNLTSIKVGRREDAEKMQKEGYFESYPLGKIDPKQTHDTLYISRHMPEVSDVSGILSTTNQRNMGTTLTEIFMRDPAYQTDGKPDFVAIKQKVKKFIKDQDRKANLTENRDFKLRPIRDENGRITDYRVMMDHASMKKMLRPDLEIQNVFAHMNSSLVDRQATLENNIATIDILVDERLDLMESHKDEFTDLLDPDGAYIERYYKLPKAVRDYIMSYSTDGTFMVRTDVIDKVFGYKSFDVTQLQVLDKHPRVKYVAGMAHYMIRQIVGYGKDRIVIGMPQVIINNLLSNISQLSMRKIPISYTFYKIVEGISEYKKYRTANEERTRLQQLKNSKNLPANSPEAQQIVRLTAQIENNKLHKMSKAGLNSLIVEDINDAQTDGYFNRMRHLLRLESFKWKDYTDRVPKSVGTAASLLFVTKGSKPYQISRHLVQMTDFLGRYVMIEHATKVQNKDFKTAMHEALNAFVLFDEALVPALEAVDAIGATSFLSYFLRNQRASKQLAEASPTSVALSAAIQHATGIPTLGNVNASWLAGDFSPNTFQFDDLFDEANNATGIEILAWAKGLFS